MGNETVLRSSSELQAVRERFAAQEPASEGTERLVVRSVARLVQSGSAPNVVAISVPGSKSFTNRAVVLAALAGRAGRALVLNGCLFSDDSFWGLDALLRLGYTIEVDWECDQVRLEPPPGGWHVPAGGVDLHMGMAGTLGRFFPSVILNARGAAPGDAGGHERVQSVEGALLSAEPRLCERPLADLILSLRQLGARIDGDALPLRVYPSRLSGACTISGARSGQFLSGLVLAAVASSEPVTIKRVDNLVQPDYVRMTIDAARNFGADIEADADLTLIKTRPVLGGLYPAAGSYTVEADASTACYYLALAALLGIRIKVVNLGAQTRQPDLRLVDVLQRMGAEVHLHDTSAECWGRKSAALPPQTSAPPVSGYPSLQGGYTLDFTPLSDQALTAGVLALFADAPITITGVAHIRKHESDRVACFCANVNELGGEAIEHPDGFTVKPLGERTLRGVWKTHGDHRFAMCGFLLATRMPEVSIADPACCEKTAPGFFADMQRLGVDMVALKS